MPARQYYFSSQNITRDGKHKKAIPKSQWKGPGAYYLRTNAKTNERYWALRSVAKDISRKRPQGKRDAYGTGAYSQYHDVGKGPIKDKGITKTRKDKAVVRSIKRKGYPSTAILDASQAKISRATLQRTRAEKRRLLKSRRATAKRKSTAKPKAVKRKPIKRKATVKRKATTKRKTVKRSTAKRKPAKRKSTKRKSRSRR